MKSRHHCALLLASSVATALAQSSVSTDLWDITQGSSITASSPLIPGAGSPAGLFGQYGQNNWDGNTWTYFADGQPANYVHFVEWQTTGPVTLAEVRLFGFGDDFLNNGREFDQFVLKTKSPGSSTFDVTLITFTPTHPYSFVDAGNNLILDQTITPVVGQQFRAEFTQYTAGNGYDGPRILELDGLGVPPPPPPVISSQPQSLLVNYNTPVLLSVEATGTGRLNFQWYKNGVALTGETHKKLRIHAAKLEDAGNYHVSITDNNGTTVSADASVNLDLYNMRQSSFDLWDSHRAITITGHSDYHSSVVHPLGMFGAGQPADESDMTYFADNQPDGTIHYVEWSTVTPVTLKAFRLFAHGDDFLNYGREFDSMTLRAKSPGSSTFDILIGTFTPNHPYTFLDYTSFAIIDAEIAPVQASAFRAEFEQYTAGYGYDGPRIIELDGFNSHPMLIPSVVTSPQPQTVVKDSNVTFSVLARGGNLKYKWRVNGQDIRGATSSTLTLTSVQLRDQGNYTVVVTNDLGSVESAPGLLLVLRR